MITVECPHCGVTMAVDEQYIGKKGRCERCKNIVTIRVPDDGDDEDNDPSVHDDPLPLDLEFDGGAGDPFGENPFTDAGEGIGMDLEPGAGISAMFAQAEVQSHSTDGGANEPPAQEEPAQEPAAAGVTAEEPADHGKKGDRMPASAESKPGSQPEPPPSFAAAKEQHVKKKKSFRIQCPHCTVRMRVSAEHIGKKGRCHRCQSIFRLSRKPDGDIEVTLLQTPEPAAPAESPPSKPVEAPTAGSPAEARVAKSDSRESTKTPSEPAVKRPRMGAATSAQVDRPAGDFTQIRIESVEPILVNLPCTGTFVLAGGTYASKGTPTPRVLVKVVGSNGVVGWGEVTPCPSWCYETSETIVSTIRNYLAPAVCGLNAWDRDLVTRTMEHVIQPGATIGQPLAKSGVDTALHDMVARTLEIPLYALFGSKRCDEIWLSYIVSGHSVDEALPQVRQGLERGYSAFKIKVGMNNEAVDREIIEAVTETVPKGTFLWVDANQGYELDVAIRQARIMGQLGVHILEQPIKGARISAFRRLVALGSVPIAIDETVCSATDLIEYIKAEAVDVPIAKVQRCGGHYHSARFCSVAESSGLRLMGSGLCETDLGLAHGIQLFAAFGIDLPCDLNGRQFVDSCYLAETISIRNGRVEVPDRPGCGVVVDEEKVSEFAADG